LDDIENQEGIIDKIIALYTFLLELFKTCNASFIYDIKKYYPDIFKMFDEYKDNILKKLVIALINKGKKMRCLLMILNRILFFQCIGKGLII